VGVLNIHDIMLASNVPANIYCDKKMTCAKVASQVVATGAESAVCDCLVVGTTHSEFSSKC